MYRQPVGVVDDDDAGGVVDTTVARGILLVAPSGLVGGQGETEGGKPWREISCSGVGHTVAGDSLRDNASTTVVRSCSVSTRSPRTNNGIVQFC